MICPANMRNQDAHNICAVQCLGTPALTTRGLKVAEMSQVAAFIDRVLSTNGDAEVTKQVREDVRALCAKFPLW